MMFESLKLVNFDFKNRLTVAPLTRVSATQDGRATAQMRDYYQQYVDGGFGCIITEGLYTDTEYSQGYKFQPGLVNDAQTLSWKALNDYAKSKKTIVIAQLMHAGALSQHNEYQSKTKAPSSVKPVGSQMTFYYGEGEYNVPTALSQTDIQKLITGFVDAACFAKASGFSGIEVHGANGYLLDQFLTVTSNQREDEFGGSVENRLKLHAQIIERIRAQVGKDFIIGLRISQAKVNEPDYKWSGADEAKAIFTHLDTLDIDYLHLAEPNALESVFDTGLSLASFAKQYTSKVVMNNGQLNQHHLITKALEDGSDLVSIGKMAIANPDFPLKLLSHKPLTPFTFDIFNPIANLSTQFATLSDANRSN